MIQNTNVNYFSYSNLDLYHFNKVVQSWNIDFLQLNSGKFFAQLKQCVCDDFQLGYAKFNKVVKQEGFSPKGVWTFAFVNDVNIFWRNYRLEPKSIIIYSPGSEINAVSDINFEVMTFSISEDYLLEIAKKERLEKFVNSLRSKDLFTAMNPLWGSLRNSIVAKINKKDKELSSDNLIRFKESFTKKLLSLLNDSNVNEDIVSGVKRLKLLSAAEGYILEHITEPIKVRNLASLLNVSERTLLYAFKNRFNMGPKAFMNVIKLNHVHQRLHDEKNNFSIASMARDSGFWHMGQFFKDYKKFFGELPSDTFRKNIK